MMLGVFQKGGGQTNNVLKSQERVMSLMMLGFRSVMDVVTT